MSNLSVCICFFPWLFAFLVSDLENYYQSRAPNTYICVFLWEVFIVLVVTLDILSILSYILYMVWGMAFCNQRLLQSWSWKSAYHSCGHTIYCMRFVWGYLIGRFLKKNRRSYNLNPKFSPLGRVQWALYLACIIIKSNPKYNFKQAWNHYIIIRKNAWKWFT